MPGPSAASASARTSALVIIPARCSNASSGSAQRVGVRGGQTVARPSVGSCTMTTLGSANGGSAWRRSSGVPSASATTRVAVARARRRSAAVLPGCGEDRDLRVAQRGVDRGARVAAVGGDDERVVPRDAEPRERDRDRRRRGVDVEPVGERGERADDAEEARVARREHARPARARATSARSVASRSLPSTTCALAGRERSSTARPPATTSALREQRPRSRAARASRRDDAQDRGSQARLLVAVGRAEAAVAVAVAAGRRRATGRRPRRRRARGRRARAPAS